MFDLDIHAGGDSFLNTTLCDCLRALSLYSKYPRIVLLFI